jgi:hypothetical protein
MRTSTMRLTILISILFLLGCASTGIQHGKKKHANIPRASRKAYQATDQVLRMGIEGINDITFNKYSRIDTILIDKRAKKLDIHFNQAFTNIPIREATLQTLKGMVQTALGRKYTGYQITFWADEHLLSDYIPNFYRLHGMELDKTRLPAQKIEKLPLVRKLDQPVQPSKGLYNRNIAMWHSHGWYYEQKLDRWEWQRARVFQTVEDMLPMSFTLPYLAPMLENAGAQVFLPRERDIQVNEVIVDNDASQGNSDYRETSPKASPWESTENLSGFAMGTPPYKAGENPFRLGTQRRIQSSQSETATVNWIPDIPEAGRYAVYVSFGMADDNVSDAFYSVHHLGGITRFLVNQQISGNTWVYLGHFQFAKGKNPDQGQVILSNQSGDAEAWVSADAVRFGGGMGNIEREGQISERPRFVEAARYYLQYAGMPDTLVFSLNNEESDYKDDYQCRGEWVNYLNGAPSGPNKDRLDPGLGIPIDLSFAFHTDAGFTRNDTVIGTLSIYSDEDDDEVTTFPTGMSRMANRDLADILQTQLVDDIRAKYDPAWNRRMLWNRGYSEAYRPNVPAVLLELLSHHNFLDMKFANDPRFKFDVSRSIYKAFLKFISAQNGTDYVVQPLPVNGFIAELTPQGGALLQWTPVDDPLEPSAVAEKYIVYTREEGRDFDNGILVDDPEYTTESLVAGTIYSFKVSAVNAGGESFPSEILSVCYLPEGKGKVLILNAFDRISAAATIETEDYLGFADFKDAGVPDKVDMNYIGIQYDLMADSPWLDDDAPGHGASYGDLETTLIPGNSFDFPYLHGQAIKAAGYSFVSSSDEAVMNGMLDMAAYPLLDIILGEEMQVPGPKASSPIEFRGFPKALQQEITRFQDQGGNIFVSGAHVGFDLFANGNDSLDMAFGQDVLRFSFRTNHAVKNGAVKSIDEAFKSPAGGLRFNTGIHPELYTVESPDAIEASGDSTRTIMRYVENNTSAAIASEGEGKVVVFGFPFETILSAEDRTALMEDILTFLSK